MIFTPADSVSLIAFIIIVITVISAFLFGVYTTSSHSKGSPVLTTLRVFIGIFVWLGVLSGIIFSGVLELQPMPWVLIFFAFINLAALLMAFSPLGKQLATRLTLGQLVAFQAFRLPLEIVLHSWVSQGTIPQTMTWTGHNFDIFSGILAILVAPIADRSRAATWVMNSIGFILLLNVIRVAILSLPLPFAWSVQPPLQLIYHIPYFLIGPVCVSGALAGHIVLTRALLLKKQ